MKDEIRCPHNYDLISNFVLSPYIKQALININHNKISHWKIIPYLDIIEDI